MYKENKTKGENICFELDGIKIQPENEVKLLGVTCTIDLELKFSTFQIYVRKHLSS